MTHNTSKEHKELIHSGNAHRSETFNVQDFFNSLARESFIEVGREFAKGVSKMSYGVPINFINTAVSSDDIQNQAEIPLILKQGLSSPSGLIVIDILSDDVPSGRGRDRRGGFNIQLEIYTHNT